MNKVIIFGGDHYNALGLVRVFGKNGIKPYGVLTINPQKEKASFASKSKYWEKVWLVHSEKEGLNIIKNFFCQEKKKPVIIPSSDGAEVIIDEHLDELKDIFIVPGINQIQGAVVDLMNKTNQIKWADELGLRTANSWELLLSDTECVNLIKSYPCILKPVLSSEGQKADIVKCEDIDAARIAIQNLRNKGYKRILAQEFLDKEYEVELFGCISQNSKITPYLLSKHVREWPSVAGSVSCHEFIIDKKYKAEAERILQKIMDYGFNGNIDIELFMINGLFYLNEVNFRNSGDVYACFRNKLYYPLIWFLDSIGENISSMNMQYDNEKFAMNETTDFRHVIYGELSLSDWLYYKRKCGDYALWFKGDIKPALLRYKYFISQALLRGPLKKFKKH